MSQLNLEAVLHAFRYVAEANDWSHFHSPRNLAAAVSVEAGELLEIFQWLDDADSRALRADESRRTAVAGEIADILMYLVALCDELDIDLPAAVQAKIDTNRRRFAGSES